jgi:hypothetical protein
MPSRVTSVTTRRFPPELLVELVEDVIYEITDRRNLLPALPRVRSFTQRTATTRPPLPTPNRRLQETAATPHEDPILGPDQPRSLKLMALGWW